MFPNFYFKLLLTGHLNSADWNNAGSILQRRISPQFQANLSRQCCFSRITHKSRNDQTKEQHSHEAEL